MALKDTLQFGGTSDYLVIPHSASTNLTGAFTLSAWVNLLSSGVGVSRDNTIFGKFYGPGNLRSYFLRSNISEQLELNVSPDGTAEHTITGNTTLLADTWYYVVAKYTGTELQLFLNGVSDATPVAYSLGVLSTPSVGTAIGDKFGAAIGSGVGMEGNIALPMMFTGDVPAESIYSFEQGTSYGSLPLSLRSEVLLAPPCYDTTSPTDDIGPFSNTVTPMGSLSITTPQLNIVEGLCTILGGPARYISGGETTTGTRLLTDDEYRLFIKARIAKNQSKGTIDSIVDMIAFLIGATGFAVSDGPGAAEFSVVFDNGTLTENDRVFISQSDLIPKPAGVGLNLFEYPVNGAFAYAGAPGDIAGYNVGQYIDLL